MPHTRSRLTPPYDCLTLWKAARHTRQAAGRRGHVPVAHPTKKVTRARLRTSHNLPRNHRRFTIKQLIRRLSS